MLLDFSEPSIDGAPHLLGLGIVAPVAENNSVTPDFSAGRVKRMCVRLNPEHLRIAGEWHFHDHFGAGDMDRAATKVIPHVQSIAGYVSFCLLLVHGHVGFVEKRDIESIALDDVIHEVFDVRVEQAISVDRRDFRIYSRALMLLDGKGVLIRKEKIAACQSSPILPFPETIPASNARRALPGRRGAEARACFLM